MPDIKITRGYLPGSIGRVVELHGTYYHAHWGFGSFFESKVAADMAEFIGRYDENQDGFWTVSLRSRIEGSIAIDGIHAKDEGAHLRWFIVSDTLRGKGTGNLLIQTAVDFCQNKHFECVYLWTFEGLHAAKHLYEKYGFELVTQHEGKQWGKMVKEQRFELTIQSHGSDSISVMTE
ncbi:MAG: GNAT family N-acetyltransferase [Desulfobacterales bacterium]